MKVFISYAHQNPEHKLKVRKLADSLRAHGIDATIDQYVQGAPPEGWPRWMDRMLETSDRVLVVCSDAYQRRWNRTEEAGKGLGVTWEATFALDDLYGGQGKNDKFIPVIFSESDKACIPKRLRNTTCYLIEEQYEDLYRTLTGQSRVQTPVLGPSIDLPGEERPEIFSLDSRAYKELPTGSRVPPVPSRKDPPNETVTAIHATRRDITEKHRALARRYLPGQWGANDVPADDLFDRYATLYHQLLDLEKVGTFQKGPFFQALANFALKQPRSLLRIQGSAGTGKTTLLALLYFYYLARQLNYGDETFPFFLHLGEYDGFGEEEARRRCQEDLAEIKAVMSYSEESSFILLVDGFDNFLEFRRDVEEEILHFGHPGLKLIVGICLGIDLSDHPQRFEWDETPVVSLRNFHPRSKGEIDQVVEAFLRTRDTQEAKVHDAFKSYLDRFRFSRVDVRTLAMLMRRWEREAYSGVNSLFDLLQRYCREFLAPQANDAQYAPILKSVAALAYDHLYKDKNLPPAEQRASRGWRLAHHNVEVRDYLVARHITGCLLASAEEGGELSVLGHVYPYRITRHAKAILSENPKTQRKAVDASKRIVASEEVIAKTNVSYFLGRLTDAGAKQEAARLLRSVLKQTLKEKGEGREILRLKRTIYVSLIYLGDRDASEKYIEVLVGSPDWDDINRGFHLEYYGDIVVDPWSDYLHVDTLEDFPLTFERLYESVQKNLRARNYPPRELEIYTLFSLAQKRHAGGVLNQEIRLKLLDLIPSLLVERLESEVLQGYLRMLQTHFQKEAFSVGGVIEDLYRIKEERRKGWVVRGLLDTEHVADHMYGAYLLGLLFLPEAMEEGSYSKDAVLRTVLIHDLAEAYTGDILSREKKEKDRETEASWLEYLGMLGTYIGLADTREIAQLYRTYEARNGINARIARDLDNLDVFVQLHLYRRRGEIRDFEEWKQEISDELLTSEGRRILDLLQKHFENGGGSAARLPDALTGENLLQRVESRLGK